MNEQNFSERLKTFRKQKGLTQQQLADLLNVSNKSVSRWESAGGYPDIEVLPALAKALGVTVDELLSDTPVRRLSAFDWQNMLSFAFAIGGGVLFFLLKLFTPTILCYAIYLGVMGYGVYLQSRYTYRSDWFYRFHLLTNFTVNLSLLATLPWFATSLTLLKTEQFMSTFQNFQLQATYGFEYQGTPLGNTIQVYSEYYPIAALWLILGLILTAITHRILYKHLDHAAPESVWAILRGLFSAEFRAKVKAVMPEINENYHCETDTDSEEKSENQ